MRHNKCLELARRWLITQHPQKFAMAYSNHILGCKIAPKNTDDINYK